MHLQAYVHKHNCVPMYMFIYTMKTCTYAHMCTHMCCKYIHHTYNLKSDLKVQKC